MNHIERVLTTINHLVPDRVPRGEFQIAPGLIEKFCPEPGLSFPERQRAVMELLGMDFLALTPGSSFVLDKPGGTGEDVWGRTVTNQRGHLITVKPAILSIDEAHLYRFPDPGSFDFTEIKTWVQKTPYFIFALLDGIFQGTACLFNFNQFMMSTAAEPEKLRCFAEAYGEYLYQAALFCVKSGAHGIIIGDDMAYNQGTLISLNSLEQIFFPAYEKLISKLKALGKPVFLHCDGNINSLLPAIAAMGFAGVHSLEPAAGMDLKRVKHEYGSKLCLIGNIDPALLIDGSPSEVLKEVQNVLKTGSPGGGFILSTASGTLTDEMAVENILAMYKI